MAICWYHLPVALNIKDPEVDRLAAELADRLHTSKTAAIRHALSAQLAFWSRAPATVRHNFSTSCVPKSGPCLPTAPHHQARARTNPRLRPRNRSLSTAMIVDTSAVVALVQGERPHATLVAAALAGAHSPVMSAPTVAECLIVLTARHGPVARTIFERLRSEIGLSVSSFTAEHAAATQRAFLRYGKGRHRAALNFGDCMTYATAQLGHQPLLAVGNDFPQTDHEFRGVVGYWPGVA